MEIAPNMRPDAFAGTAEAYLRYRPPYPRALLADLLGRAALPATPTLLDLACGPGRVALDLAPTFARVWAIDLEPEMVAAGRAEAARRGIGNVSWSVGRAEDAEFAAGSIDLITIGEAFHRLDQPVILGKALRWLKPGGGIAALGVAGPMAGDEPWEQAAAEVMRRWAPAGWAQARPGAAQGPEGHERVLREAGFVDVATCEVIEPRDLSFEEVVGYLRSTSICSQHALGDGFAAFAAELKATLGADEGRVFREEMRSGYTFGRKPR